MAMRPRFRATVLESLEERLVLNGASAYNPFSGYAIPSAVAKLGPVGAMGDSYTDEYQFSPPNRIHARNWVEMLHTLRGVDFGKKSFRSLGVPRNQGFAYNWAESGATTETMVTNQLPGLAQQVAEGKVKYAWILIGGNDFLHYLAGVQEGLIPPQDAVPALEQTTVAAEVNVKTAVDTLLAANPNVRVVLANVANVADFPVAQEAATTPLAREVLAAVGQAIDQYNASIAIDAASSPRVALVDLAGATAQVASSPTGTFSFGGQTINLLTPGNDYHDFFLADGLHVGTVAQGIIADEFALAVDAKFGANLFPLDPREILRYAQIIQNHSNRLYRR